MASDYERWVAVDLSRLRTAFVDFDPQARQQVAQALRGVFPNLLVTPMASGAFAIELLSQGSGTRDFRFSS